MSRLVLLLMLILSLAVPLAGCGKKGPPKPPGESNYPRSYPRSG